MRSALLAVSTAAVLATLPAAAGAVVIQFNALINTAQEVPTPTGSSANGVATLFYDTATDTYDFGMSVFGLTGASGGRAASGFHIHGAAAPGETAPVRVFLDNAALFTAFNSGNTLLVGGNSVAAPAGVPATPMTMTNPGYPAMSFLQMLQSGLAYVNVHTALNPAGEARGQLLQVAVVPEPGTYALLAAGLGVVGAVARRRRTAAQAAG